MALAPPLDVSGLIGNGQSPDPIFGQFYYMRLLYLLCPAFRVWSIIPVHFPFFNAYKLVGQLSALLFGLIPVLDQCI